MLRANGCRALPLAFTVACFAFCGTAAYAQRIAGPLTAGVAVSVTNPTIGTYNDYSITLPGGATRLRVTLSGGTGDADLYVRLGDFPTTAVYSNLCGSAGNSACISTTNLSNNEFVFAPSPGTGVWYISLYAARAFANVNVVADYDEPELGEAIVLNGMTDPLAAHFRFFWQKVPRTYWTALATAEGVGATGDVDLYFRYGNLPSALSFTCKSTNTRSNEACPNALYPAVANSAGSTGFTGLYAYQPYTGVNFTVDSVSGLTVPFNNNLWFQTPIPFGARNVTFALNNGTAGTGDCDIFTYLGSRTNFVSSGEINGNDDQASWSPSTYRQGTAYVRVHGYDGCASVGLRVRYNVIRSDLDANNRADIVLQHPSTGDIANWLMNSTTIEAGRLAADPGVPGPGYTVVAQGDFNRNWTSELVLRAADGRIVFWTMNGTAATNGYVIDGPPSFNVAGVGDFNGDGNSDLILRNPTTGELAIWLLNGVMPPSIQAGSAVFAILAGWTVAGVGDFDVDGKSDVLLFNASTNTAAIWLMEGAVVRDGRPLAVTPGWSPKAVGDLDGNNYADILLQNTSGEVAAWLMEGFNLRNGVYSGSAGSYVVRHVADYDGDGNGDALMQDGVGNVVIWLLDGGTIRPGSALIGNPGAYRVRMQP